MMRVIFLGADEFAVPSLEAMASHGHDICAVVTQPDRPAGRGRKIRPTPVKRKAQEMGLPLLEPENVSARESVLKIASLRPDLFVVVAYGQILSAELLRVPSRGGINLHASLLPRYRGPAPVAAALLEGTNETGVTTLWISEQVDAGDTILQRRMPILDDDTEGSLSARLAAEGAKLLLETLALVERDQGPRQAQNEAEATWARPLRKKELEVNWTWPARRIANLVRAASPAPGCCTYHKGKRLKIWRTAAVEAEDETQPGLPAEPTPPKSPTLHSYGDGPATKAEALAGQASAKAGTVTELTAEGFFVQAGLGKLLVIEVQPESRRRMSAAAYAHGHLLVPGEKLGAHVEQDVADAAAQQSPGHTVER
jgi:methionyl-tRNA formyltransferase